MNTTNHPSKIDKVMLFALFKDGAYNQAELSRMFGVTRGRIHQLIKRHLSIKQREKANKLYLKKHNK